MTADQNERIMIKAEITRFAKALDQLHRGLGVGRRGKPPESGLSVPAVPPSGP